ncbi:MAG: hypothetical protein M1831_006105 [Alyxoria varia]|nr:MAG: hypothetical protein M1831_006105 [Alyxoria varia]
MTQPFNQSGIPTYTPLLLLRCEVTQPAKDTLDKLCKNKYPYENNNVFVLNLEETYACDGSEEMMDTLSYAVQREVLKAWNLDRHFPWHKFEVNEIKAIFGSEKSFGSAYVTPENVERILQMVVQGRVSGSYVAFQLRRKPPQERQPRFPGTDKQSPSKDGMHAEQKQGVPNAEVHKREEQGSAKPQANFEKNQGTSKGGLWNNLFSQKKQ